MNLEIVERRLACLLERTVDYNRTHELVNARILFTPSKPEPESKKDHSVTYEKEGILANIDRLLDEIEYQLNIQSKNVGITYNFVFDDKHVHQNELIATTNSR